MTLFDFNREVLQCVKKTRAEISEVCNVFKKNYFIAGNRLCKTITPFEYLPPPIICITSHHFIRMKFIQRVSSFLFRISTLFYEDL